MCSASKKDSFKQFVTRMYNRNILERTRHNEKPYKNLFRYYRKNYDLKKLEDAIKMFQKKIKKQGRVTNARDEQHLKQLIKVYKDMGGRKIKEGKITEDSKLKVGDKVTFLKYPGIIKKVHSGGMKGMVDVKLRSALKGDRVALRQAKEATDRLVRSKNNLSKGMFDTEHSTRILGGSFAVLRSKMLLASFGAGLFGATIGRVTRLAG